MEKENSPVVFIGSPGFRNPGGLVYHENLPNQVYGVENNDDQIRLGTQNACM
jgi:hypothetical protein